MRKSNAWRGRSISRRAARARRLGSTGAGGAEVGAETRVDSDYYPDTVSAKVYYGSTRTQHMKNACQFSFRLRAGTDLAIQEGPALRKAMQVASVNFRCDSDCRALAGRHRTVDALSCRLRQPVLVGEVLERTGKRGL